ncbi:hypothetical protein [Micromonospora sp. NPDC023737]|uniref:hypothetical protein n=1 Tax=unclassified Micromonospora TaxID=2617518 RepID=UPI0033D14476
MSRREGPDPERPPETQKPPETGEPQEEAEHPGPIQARPTANPARVRMPAEGRRRKTDDEADPEASGPPPGEET